MAIEDNERERVMDTTERVTHDIYMGMGGGEAADDDDDDDDYDKRDGKDSRRDVRPRPRRAGNASQSSRLRGHRAASSNDLGGGRSSRRGRNASRWGGELAGLWVSDAARKQQQPARRQE